jgi:hypothetical protein
MNSTYPIEPARSFTSLETPSFPFASKWGMSCHRDTGHGAQHIRARPLSLSSRRVVKNPQCVKLEIARDTLDEITLRRMHHFRRNKFVADSVDGSNKGGTVRIVLDFLSQSYDAIVDSAATGAFPLRPQGAD